MRYLILVVCCAALFSSKAQTSNSNTGNQFFAQIQVDNSNPATVGSVVASLNSNPNIFVVRYDEITDGLLFITNSISAFDQTIMETWFEGNESIIECSRIGIQGTDAHIAFGTNFCNQAN